jgi:hypothetical protein
MGLIRKSLDESISKKQTMLQHMLTWMSQLGRERVHGLTLINKLTV